MKRTRFDFPHNWNKISWNPNKEGDHIYQCAICGIKGKRHKSAKSVTPDYYKSNCKRNEY